MTCQATEHQSKRLPGRMATDPISRSGVRGFPPPALGGRPELATAARGDPFLKEE
jgi:hypothetical protein